MLLSEQWVAVRLINWRKSCLVRFFILQAKSLSAQPLHPSEPSPKFSPFDQQMSTSLPMTPRAVDHAKGQPVVEKENRRIQRISLPLPVRVEVRLDPTVNWYEITRLKDVSAFGAGFTLKRP